MLGPFGGSILHVCIFVFITVANCNDGFLAKQNPLDNLLSDLGLGGALGQDQRRGRIAGFENEMRPMFAALPKETNGLLNHAVARYALHRFFVQKHGWYVQGLRLVEESWGASSPTDILKGKMPDDVHAVVEKHLGDHGFGLHELAVLAATLDDLIHGEAMDLLYSVYQTYRVSVHATLNKYMTDLMTRTFLAYHIIPPFRKAVRKRMKPKEFDDLLKKSMLSYPGFDATSLWANDLREDLKWVDRDKLNPFVEQDTSKTETTFASMTRLVEGIGDRFGRFQDLECRSMKLALIDVEDRGTGRVPLAKFYQRTLDGKGLFQESKEYLQEHGMLDETDPDRPSVIVPNYLNAQSNCIAASSFYSVCCIDECVSLMGVLEDRVAKPYAKPEEIVDFATNTPSDTVRAPRNLSFTLQGRLTDIAAQHNGTVPLHGRLFAQWMHHAYPRECSFPVIGKEANGWQTSEEIRAAVSDGSTSSLTVLAKEDLANVINETAAADPGKGSKRNKLLWTEDEKLINVVEPSISAPLAWTFKAGLRVVMGFAMLSATLVAGLRSLKSASGGLEISRKVEVVKENDNISPKAKPVKKIRSHLV